MYVVHFIQFKIFPRLTGSEFDFQFGCIGHVGDVDISYCCTGCPITAQKIKKICILKTQLNLFYEEDWSAAGVWPLLSQLFTIQGQYPQIFYKPQRNPRVVDSDVTVRFQLIIGLDTLLIVLKIGFEFVNFIPCSKILQNIYHT